ncbi:FecR family protein [Flavobacteriaceae bacterium MAR_2010_105]|nr:FecR family protein [Flavobacteriaceae bacterium MAR_2010_105]
MNSEKDILKWFDNELSEAELKDLKQSDDFETLEKIGYYASQLEAPKVDAQKALEAFKVKHAKKAGKVIHFNFKSIMKVAAVIAILLTSSYFLFFNTQQTFKTELAETRLLSLPDNSEVILNAESVLSFNKKTWQNKRDLDLNGEAFFKVSKGQTFSVNTTAGIVKVLGTQFNVKERDNYFEVHCYEGLVSVTYNGETVKLSKGNIFRVINGTIEHLKDVSSLNPPWMQSESSFNRVPLAQVIDELERQYDINIQIDGIDTNQLYTGTFTHDNKATALESVTIPLKLSYKLDGKNVIFYQYNGK